MSKRRFLETLSDELPGLLKAGVLNEESVQNLRLHYGLERFERRTSRLPLLLSILGTLLIGTGIILVLGRNWYEFSKPARTVLSFLPLVVAQGFAFFAGTRRVDAAGLRESAAGFLVLGFAASFSLVTQTYHLVGDLKDFLFICAIFNLPVIYLFQSSFAAALYMVALLWMASLGQLEGRHGILFWPFFVAAVPFAVSLYRKDAYSIALGWVCRLSYVTVAIAAGVTLEKNVPGLWIILYASLFSFFYFAGKFWFPEAQGFWQRPFQNFGAAGLCVFLWLLSFTWPWESIGWSYYRNWGKYDPVAGVLDYVLLIVFFLAAMAMLRHWMKRKETDIFEGLVAFAPLLTLTGFLFAQHPALKLVSMTAVNFYLLAISTVLMTAGAESRQLGKLNAGIFLFGALLAARFMDLEISYLLRGLLFILLGVGFLVANLKYSHRKKETAS